MSLIKIAAFNYKDLIEHGYSKEKAARLMHDMFTTLDQYKNKGTKEGLNKGFKKGLMVGGAGGAAGMGLGNYLHNKKKKDK